MKTPDAPRARGKPRNALPDDDDATIRVPFLAKVRGIRWIDQKAAERGPTVTRADIIREALSEYKKHHPLKTAPMEDESGQQRRAGAVHDGAANRRGTKRAGGR